MKCIVLVYTLAGTVSAFSSSSMIGRHVGVVSTYMAVSSDDNESTTTMMTPSSDASSSVAAAAASMNGWIPDDTQACYGLPGALPPMGYFDPIGFARPGISLNEIKRYREAEVQHGRVAMMAFLGYVAGETIPASPFGITGPANDQLQQMPLPAFALLTTAIAAAELKRATIGWIEPDFSRWTKTLFTLRDNYYPGDLGFDPLGLKSEDASSFASMQTRELQNGRLAMLGVAGICAQELVNHKTIMMTIDFYQKVYSGINPYE